MEVKQYQIVLVNLDSTVGSEIKKTRPCVVISPNEMNRYLQTIVIAPITSSSREFPTRVPLVHRKKACWAVLDQIRTIDRQRIIKHQGTLSANEIIQVKQILKETYID